MKNIRFHYEKKNKLFSKLIEEKKIALFGYNEIAVYFLKVKLTNICVVEKKFLKKKETNQSNIGFNKLMM